MGKGPAWSVEEIAILVEGREAGLPFEDIAARLPRRTPFAVKTKSAVMGLDTRQIYRAPVSPPRRVVRPRSSGGPDPADLRLGRVMRAAWHAMRGEAGKQEARHG
ncbi:SANT/Myb-like DNA-binding domain-containing protein [Hyphobacterium sp.]|uniref:SANT/Myb-like DNA-binding domain-containing protein n=1 Tax=Hyphobacterium sp. TaxID=2004662 RepID=UPI003BA8CD5D